MIMECKCSACFIPETGRERGCNGITGIRMDEKPKRGGGEGVSTSNESYKLATGGSEASKDSCVTQACTGTAISLGFISCRKWGVRKPTALWKKEVLHLLLGGVEFQRSLNLPFPFLLSSSHPSNVTDAWLATLLKIQEACSCLFWRKPTVPHGEAREEHLFSPYSVTILLTEVL